MKNTVLRTGIGLIIGQRGAGKTAIAIALATALAAGQPYFGRKVKAPCGVIYLAAEGAGQVRYRMRAAKKHLGIDGAIPFVCIDKPYNLNSESSAFIELCKKSAAWLKARFGVETCLLIIDTAIQAFFLEDENNAAEIAAICRALAHIGRATGCFTLAAVHAGKDVTLGARGSSVWLSNVDIALFVSGDRDEVKGTCENRALSQTKNRDGPEGPISAFDLTLIELGRDADGEPFGAMAVEPNAARPATDKTHKWNAQQTIFREAFGEVALTRGRKIRVGSHWLTAVEASTLRQEFCKRIATGEKDKEKAGATKRQAWRRAVNDAFLKSVYQRDTREDVELIWNVKDEEERA